jgi:Tol biopolymer transport system component
VRSVAVARFFAVGFLLVALMMSPDVASGEEVQVIQVTNSPTADFDPAWSPDGRRLAFARATGPTRIVSDLFVLDLETGTETRLTFDACNAPPTCPMLVGNRNPSWSPDGDKLAFIRHQGSTQHLFIYDFSTGTFEQPGGSTTPITTHAEGPSWSPDGSQIAYWEFSGTSLWVINPDGTGQHVIWDGCACWTPQTADDGPPFLASPAWSPDGHRLAAVELESGLLYTLAPDGSQRTQVGSGYPPINPFAEHPFGNTVPDRGEPDWQRNPDATLPGPNGKIAFSAGAFECPDQANCIFEPRDIYTINADGSDLQQVTSSPADDGGAAWSPDGTRLAFNSDRTGNYELFVTEAPPLSGTVVIKKATVPAGAEGTFEFGSTIPGCESFTLSDGGTKICPVIPGTSFVDELGETPGSGRFLLTDISCDDSDSGRTDPNSIEAKIVVAQGETVTCTFTNTVQSGTVVIKKATVPAGDSATFAFTGDAAGTIADGQTITVPGLAPGTYSSTETVPSGWDLASISCDDGQSASASSGDVATATATFRLDPGETISCTFTDDKRGTIVVKKQTQPAGAAGSFTFSGDAAGSIGEGGTITVLNLATVGSPTYHSTETNPTPNFDLTSISCDDDTSQHPSGSDLASRTASFRLDPGETVTCTFTDTQRGTVSVRKTVSGSPPSILLPPAQQSFTFQLRQGASTTSAGTLLDQADATVANGGVVQFTTKLVAGSPYQLCEIVMPGWRTSLAMHFVLYNPSGDNSTLCTTFRVAPAEQKSIAVDNQPPPGGLSRTIGFWKNWASCASSSGNQKPVLDVTLAAAEPGGITIGTLTLHGSTSWPNRAPDCLKAVRLLNKSTINAGKKMSSDAAFNLAAQLLAANLNVKAGALTCPSAISAINDAQALLAAVHFNGISHDKLSAAQTTQANSLASTLDRYNNNLLC